MKTLDLQCPSCHQILELDAGFAGGVCRCSSCGTLMSVPGKAAYDAVARKHADRPDAPASAVKAAAPKAVVVKAAPVTEEQARAAAAKGPSAAPIPTARPKRPPRRWVKYIVTTFVVLMLAGIAAVVVFALALKLRQGETKPTVKPPRPIAPPVAIGIDPGAGANPGANLFGPEQSGFLGFALAPRTVLALDATSAASRYLPLLRPAVKQALAKAPAETALQVVLWTDLGPQVFPDQPQVLSEDDRGQVERLLLSAAPAGAGDALPAIEQALAGKPERLIIVAGDNLSPAAVAKLRESSAAIDVLLIGAHAPELQQIAESHRGKYISVPTDLLEKWRDQAGLNTPDR